MDLPEVVPALPVIFEVQCEPPEMGMIIPKVGSAACWLFVAWFYWFGGWIGGGCSCSCVGCAWVVG